jgi:hypothetical protein
MVQTPKGSKQPPERRKPESSTTPTQLLLTLDSATHELIKIERLTPTGQRRELSDEEWAKLAGGDDAEELLEALQEAYAIGVADGASLACLHHSSARRPPIAKGTHNGSASH